MSTQASYSVSVPRWRLDQLLEAEQRASRKLAATSTRPTKPKPAPSRRLSITPDVAAKIVDVALAGGQISTADGDRWRSALEANPSEAITALAKLPKDEERAARNFIADQDAAYRAHAESHLFIPAAEVV